MRWLLLGLLLACSAPQRETIVMEYGTVSDILMDSTGSYARVLPPRCEKGTITISPDSIVFDGSYENTLYVQQFMGEFLMSKLFCADKNGRSHLVVVSKENDQYTVDVIRVDGGVFLGVDTIW